jgi:hypothetical protein
MVVVVVVVFPLDVAVDADVSVKVILVDDVLHGTWVLPNTAMMQVHRQV